MPFHILARTGLREVHIVKIKFIFTIIYGVDLEISKMMKNDFCVLKEMSQAVRFTYKTTFKNLQRKLIYKQVSI